MGSLRLAVMRIRINISIRSDRPNRCDGTLQEYSEHQPTFRISMSRSCYFDP